MSIHADDGDTASEVDLVLPTSSPVVAFLPDIVELAGRQAMVDGSRWRLLRPSGTPVDEYMSLSDNGIRDGDVLLLVSESPRLPDDSPWDPARAAVTANDPRSAAPVDVTAIGAAAIVIAVAASGWIGAVGSDRSGSLVVTVAAAVVATARAVTLRRDVMGAAAVAAWAGAGFLVVPAAPAAANVLLATVAAGTAAVVLSRWTGRLSPTLVAFGAFSAILAVVAGAATAWSMPGPTVGAVTVVLALALLGASARIAAATSGLSADVAGDRAACRAHTILDGLTTGCASAVAGGAVVVAVASHDGVAAAFTAAVAVAMCLRSRAHADWPRRVASMLSGTCCAVVSLVTCAVAEPALASCYALVFVGLGFLANAVRAPGPAVRRIANAAEYAALAAVIPLACWVGGLYAAARGWYAP
ncbi:type VII secretion integral membrane protein EccD [Mycolicibacterium lacusdiani]|uniref:type VII secretion integral membrane protein EccD n=1 Tax=Mycolicibacterium lacusdiani TaxID=2895283 RepID=UPI001F031C65|nr:type VII secretion integral membrane protein EccD [Mycolicibacterium lacusdiani]